MRLPFIARTVAALALATFPSACSSGSAPSGVPIGSLGASPGPGPTIFPTAPASSAPSSALSRLYVTNDGNGADSVSVFDLTTSPPTALKPLTAPGLSEPRGVAFGAGKLYVANFTFPGSVSVFDTANNNAALAPIESGPLFAPAGMMNGSSGVAFGAGKLYVTNAQAKAVTVFDTTNNDAALTPIVVPDGYLSAAYGAGKLYITSAFSTSVRVFDTTNNNVELTPLSGSAVSAPTALAFGAGKLYVANCGSCLGAGVDNVVPFDTTNGNAPLAPIGGLSAPTGLAFGGGDLFVVNSATSSVSVFDTTNNNAPLTSIAGGGLSQPNSAAVQ